MTYKPLIVLMYHDIPTQPAGLHLYDVPMAAFVQQMRYIRELNRNSRRPCDIIITFDDGYPSWSRQVLDTLKANSLIAYFFVCIDNLKKELITAGDIRILEKNDMVIGSHGVTHKYLHTLKNKDILYELQTSQKELSVIVQKKVRTLSIPGGMYNQKVIRIARELGYKHIFTSDPGKNSELGPMMKRMPIKRSTTYREFQYIVNGKISRALLIKHSVKGAAKKIFGMKFYNKMRSGLVR